MRVSVVIPALNEEKYIEPTLFHLSRLKPYEIIVADSKSEDGTRRIARKYGARVVDAKRGAASFGRNAGGRAARGDVVLFIDADTVVFPNILEVIEKDFRSRRTAGWTCSVYGFTPSWKEQVIYNMSNTMINFLTTKMKKPHAPGIVIAVRKLVFDRVGGFDEKLKVMEDHDFAMRVGEHGNFRFSKQTCVYTSTRRMEKWGGLGLIRKYSSIYIKYFLNRGRFRENIDGIEYEVIR